MFDDWRRVDLLPSGLYRGHHVVCQRYGDKSKLKAGFESANS